MIGSIDVYHQVCLRHSRRAARESHDTVPSFEQAQDAIVRTLAIVGEAVTRLQKVAPDFIAAHPEVPWNLMRAMRNKIIHDYIDVDWNVVWSTVQGDLPALRQQISQLLKEFS